MRQTSNATRTVIEKSTPPIDAERLQRHEDDREDDRERGKQNGQCDFVRRLLSLRAFDQSNHAVEEGFARIRGDADRDDVGEHARAASHGAAVAASLANDRGGFAGDGGFIHGRGTFDDLAVARDEFARLHNHEIVLAQLLGRRLLNACLRLDAVRERLRARLPQRVGLRFAPALRHRLGKIGEEDREPKPQRNLQKKSERRTLSSREHAGRW